MDDSPTPQSTHLIVLRIWEEPLSSAKSEWRGRAEHVTSGEVRYFRDWQELVRWIEARVSGEEKAESGND